MNSELYKARWAALLRRSDPTFDEIEALMHDPVLRKETYPVTHRELDDLFQLSKSIKALVVMLPLADRLALFDRVETERYWELGATKLRVRDLMHELICHDAIPAGQIAGLKAYARELDHDKVLTVTGFAWTLENILEARKWMKSRV